MIITSLQGKEIDLNKKPDEVDYVLDAIRGNYKPVLIVCKE